MAEDKTDKEDELVVKDSTREEIDEKPTKSDEPTGTELQQAMDQAEAEVADTPAAEEPKTTKKLGRKKLSRKQLVLIISGAVALIIAILFIVPVTRYAMLGVFIKRDVTVTLLDSKTNKPVSSVAVAMANKSATTDAKGMATLKGVPVGSKKLTTHKKYYKDLSVNETVGVTGNSPSFSVNIEATGRQVPVKVVNKISQQPVEGADVTADGTSSKTDKNGEAIVVLPADKSDVDATVSLGGYNKSAVKVTVTEQQDAKNTFAVTPSGKLYFLSKRSGTIDVMKSDLDGANAQVVLKGTGNEIETGTVLLASRDWKYLALQSRRDGGEQDKLFLIDTTHDDKLTTIDEGSASFTPVGWYNQFFMYTTIRSNIQNWQPKKTAIKSYNAQTNQLSVLDETDASGSQSSYAQQSYGDTYILNNKLLYTKVWYGDSSVAKGKSATVSVIQPDGQGKQVLKDFGPVNGSVQARLYEPQSVYFQVSSYDPPYKSVYYEYEDGQMKNIDLTPETFAKAYPTFLLSPSSKYTYWSESRDGKNLLFVGNGDAQNATQVAGVDGYKSYGWFSDDYILASKNGSELYILSRTNPGTPLKVTDYHKPDVSFYGYGYGYGGF